MQKAQRHYSTAALQRARAELQQVEAELQTYEEGWGGSPLLVNPAQYLHDWVMYRNVVIARSSYLYLLERKRELQERIRQGGGA